jgi:GntR family transcriptional regulator
MLIKIDVQSGAPIYAQVVERIKHMIATGELRPGDQLPTVRQLAQDLIVNPNTIARAYALLDQAGIISTQQGRGTYVREHPDENGLVRMRKEKLASLVNQMIVEALSLGYELSEIREEFEATVRQWRKDRR